MSSLNAKDRVSPCLFTYEDSRRCRTPRTGRHPHFCFYHAQNETRAQAAEKLNKDLAYFFSGDYLSACDLSTALSRLIPAVIRGDIKPKVARTVAYMVQTLMQTIHLSQNEYINAFDTDGWRKAVRASVNGNHHYLFPPDPNENADDGEPEPEPQQPQPRHPQPQPAQPLQPSPSPATFSRSTRGPNACRRRALARPSAPAQPTTAPTPQPRNASRPSPATAEEALSIARSLFPARPNSTSPQSAAPTTNQAAPTPQPSSSTNRLDTETSQPQNATPPAPPTPQPRPTTPNRDPYAVHFDHNYRLRVDGKLF